MFGKIVYAKKLTLPSQEAGVIQSVQMAAAFCVLAAEGGPEVFFYPGLRQAGRSKNGSPLDETLEQLGIPASLAACWHPLGAANRGLYGLRFRMRILRHLASAGAKPTLFYTRDVGEAGFIAKSAGKPFLKKGPDGRFLFEMHEVLFEQHKNNPKKDWQQTRRLEQSIINTIDGLVVISPLLAEAAREHFGYTGPVLVEPSGFNGNVFRPVEMFTQAQPWPDAAADEVRLLYVGGLKEGKGVRELVRAMRHLPGNYVLHVIGGGKPEMMAELGGECRDIADYSRRIRFHGFLPQSGLQRACSGAHISVIPQQREDGFFSPMKLNESLALGLPVVCTPLNIFSGSADLVQTAADSTPAGLAAAIAALAAAPEKARALRENGIREAARHTWQNRAARILEFAASCGGRIR